MIWELVMVYFFGCEVMITLQKSGSWPFVISAFRQSIVLLIVAPLDATFPAVA